MNNEEIEEFLEFLVENKEVRRSPRGSRRGSEVRGRIGRLPNAQEPRYSLRGKPQTSYWVAKRIAEKSLVTRIDPSIVRRVGPDEQDRIREEAIGKSWKVQPGAAEEEKRLDKLQKVVGSFVKDGDYI